MQQPSGKFVLRLPPDLHRRLAERAREEGVSLNGLCVRFLDAALAGSGGRGQRVLHGVPPALLDTVAAEWAEELVGVALFGSTARGTATAGSDLDVLVVLAPPARIERSLYERWDGALERAGVPARERVAPQFVLLPDSPALAGGLWLEVAREGIVLLDTAGRLTRFLVALRDFVASGAVRRRTAHGHPYWVREEPGR